MARAGANLVGLNCLFDAFICLETLKMMKQSLDASGIKTYLMAQPLGFRTPDAGPWGWIDIPEYPYGRYLLVNPATFPEILSVKVASRYIYMTENARNYIFLTEHFTIYCSVKPQIS